MLLQLRLNNRLVNENQSIAIEGDTKLGPIRLSALVRTGPERGRSDQMNRHRIEQLIGKMNSGKGGERLDRGRPIHSGPKFR